MSVWHRRSQDGTIVAVCIKSASICQGCGNACSASDVCNALDNPCVSHLLRFHAAPVEAEEEQPSKEEEDPSAKVASKVEVDSDKYEVLYQSKAKLQVPVSGAMRRQPSALCLTCPQELSVCHFCESAGTDHGNFLTMVSTSRQFGMA